MLTSKLGGFTFRNIILSLIKVTSLALKEVKSQAETVKIVEKVITKTAYIKTKGQDIIKYLDKEVVKDNEVIKYVETCPAIPQVILKSVNEAATIPHQATK